MKRNYNELLRKIQLLSVVAFTVYPLHWICAAWRGGDLIAYTWLLSFAFLVLGTLALFVPGKLRIAYGVAACVVTCAGSYLLCGTELRMDLLLQLTLFALQLLWSLQIASWNRRTEIPGFCISLGIVAHLVGQVLLLAQWGELYAGWMLKLSFYAFVLMTMLSANRASLVLASGKRGSVPASIGRRNVLLVVSVFVLSLAGGLIPSAFVLVKDTLMKALLWISGTIAQFLSRVDTSGGEPYDETASRPQEAVGEGGGYALNLPPILETIILYIGAAISVAFLLWAAYRVIRKLMKAARESWNLFGKYLSAASEDYVDEITDTRDTGSSENIRVRRRIPRRYREDPSLPPEEQVRRRYRHLKLTHPEWSPGSTAREKLPKSAAAVYERARYSEHPVSAEEAALFRRNLEDL